jgi:hypothetical protein
MEEHKSFVLNTIKVPYATNKAINLTTDTYVYIHTYKHIVYIYTHAHARTHSITPFTFCFA